MHRDSIGSAVEIKPGEVNWMTAGKGIAHSERTPDYLRDSEKIMHGLQIWIALPKAFEQTEPNFFHAEANEIPTWTTDGVTYKLYAGEAMGKKSPVPVYSKLFMLEIKSTQATTVNLKEQLYGEVGLYILEGNISNDVHTYGPKQILVAQNDNLCDFEIAANSSIYVFGGEPFPEERFIDWNFVSSDKNLIEEAKQKWDAQLFDKVVGDELDFVPYPTRKP
jgi:redox-sensitive bicupin YhaK (pirin superfamily)